jgi:hypothetical protein
MTDNERWNPTPPGWTPTPAQRPRPRGEEVWRLVRNIPRESGDVAEHIASCELRDDSAAGAGFEVLIRHDDEIIVGRRCGDEAEARYCADVFRQDYVRTGWRQMEVTHGG